MSENHTCGKEAERTNPANTIVDILPNDDAVVDIESVDADGVGCFALPTSEDDCEAFGECLIAVILYIFVNFGLFASEIWMLGRGNTNEVVVIAVMFAHSLIILLFGLYPGLD